MTAATVTDYLDINDPTVEVVVLTVSDGNTYTSKKFGKVRAVQATGQEDVDAHLNTVISGGTIAINYAGQTSKKVCLTIYGQK